LLLFPLFLGSAGDAARKKRQEERPPEPEKAGGKQRDGSDVLLLV
jgi:hypothetical protein